MWRIEGFRSGSVVKNLPASAGDTEDVGSIPGQEDPLKRDMATHSSIFAWKIPWTEEPGGLQLMGSQRVRYDWAYVHAHTPTARTQLNTAMIISVLTMNCISLILQRQKVRLWKECSSFRMSRKDFSPLWASIHITPTPDHAAHTQF